MISMLPKTNKDSIERSAPRMFSMSEAVVARSLNAIRGWTSPAKNPPMTPFKICLFLLADLCS
jgi:hypothetical protein